MRLCAYCARRPAECVDQVDGRKVLACIPCVDQFVPDTIGVTNLVDPPITTRVLCFLRHVDSATLQEIINGLDHPNRDDDIHSYRRLSNAVQWLCQRGAEAWSGAGKGNTYSYALARPMTYREIVESGNAANGRKRAAA